MKKNSLVGNINKRNKAGKRRVPRDEPRLLKRIVELASDYGRYGYRRVTALLRREGWTVNHKRVERLWRQEDLKVPQKQPKRKRLWLADGSCVRLRPSYKDHVWSYDFVSDRTSDGRAIHVLTLPGGCVQNAWTASSVDCEGVRQSCVDASCSMFSTNERSRWRTALIRS